MDQSYIYASIGGVMIGFSVVVMMGFLGKITGISGILWNAITLRSPSTKTKDHWRYFFLGGLIAGPFLFSQLLNWQLPSPTDASIITVLASGLLVGFGTKLGSGCTSGHGVCGIGRMSTRSFVATLVFMSTGALSVLLTQLL